MGWLNEVMNHMPKNNTNKNLLWTKEKCIEISKMYNTKVEWVNNNKSSYNTARKNGWLDQCCEYMKKLLKPKGYWDDLKNCVDDAKKYNTRTRWSKSNSKAYNTARKNGWLDQCCEHMKIVGHKYKRLVYMFIFDDNYVYIGLTFNAEKRKHQHLKSSKSPVNNHIKRSGFTPSFKILTNFLDINDAAKQEKYYQEKYIKLGYKPLYDVRKSGAIGSNKQKKWTIEKCKYIANSFNSIKDW